MQASANIYLNMLNCSGLRQELHFFVMKWPELFYNEPPGCQFRPVSLCPQNHVNLVHRKGKTKVCPHPGCGKKFYLSNHLRRHMIIHSGMVPAIKDPWCKCLCFGLEYSDVQIPLLSVSQSGKERGPNQLFTLTVFLWDQGIKRLVIILRLYFQVHISH